MRNGTIFFTLKILPTVTKQIFGRNQVHVCLYIKRLYSVSQEKEKNWISWQFCLCHDNNFCNEMYMCGKLGFLFDALSIIHISRMIEFNKLKVVVSKFHLHKQIAILS